MSSFFYKEQNLEQKATSYYLNAGGKAEEKYIGLLADKIKESIPPSSMINEDIVFLCIGSDRYVGDSLGPLVGTMLKEKHLPFHVYGTLEDPVHGFNLNSILKKINKNKRKPVIIGIDASLGKRDHVGYIMFKEGPLIPGTALKKILPEIGDYHFVGFVNYIDPLPESQFLNDTRLFTVMNLAKAIVEVITEAFDETGK